MLRVHPTTLAQEASCTHWRRTTVSGLRNRGWASQLTVHISVQPAESDPSKAEKSVGSARPSLLPDCSDSGLVQANLVNKFSPILWSPCDKSSTITLAQVDIDIQLWAENVNGGSHNSTEGHGTASLGTAMLSSKARRVLLNRDPEFQGFCA
jgi:hypothetical protein